LFRSTWVAIWRLPAVSTWTSNPALANAFFTSASEKKGCFSEPITPRTTVFEPPDPPPPRVSTTVTMTATTRRAASPMLSVRRIRRDHAVTTAPCDDQGDRRRPGRTLRTGAVRVDFDLDDSAYAVGRQHPVVADAATATLGPSWHVHELSVRASL